MTLKQVTLSVLSLLVATMAIAQGYQPTPENIAARQRMANHRFGIFCIGAFTVPMLKANGI